MASARRAITLMELLVVISIIGILIGLLLPAVQAVRESAQRATCSNHLHQIALGLLGYEAAHGAYPASGWTHAGPGNPAGKYVGWRPVILPYLEQTNLHDLYDPALNWWEGTNAAAAAVPVELFLCPSVGTRMQVTSAIAHPPRPPMTFANPIAATDYEVLMGVAAAAINPHHPAPWYHAENSRSALYRDSRVRMGQVLDGVSMTLAVIECAARPLVYRRRQSRPDLANDQGIGWADSEGPFSLHGSNADGSLEGVPPDNVRALNVRNDNEPYSFHARGCQAVFLDGHSRFIRESIDLPVMAAVTTCAGREVVGDADF